MVRANISLNEKIKEKSIEFAKRQGKTFSGFIEELLVEAITEGAK